MNHYELLYILSATQTEEELQPIKESVKQLIAKFKGNITLEDTLGKRKLAYPIKNIRFGYYLLFQFDLEGEQLKALNRELQLLPGIIRHQVVTRSSMLRPMPRYQDTFSSGMEVKTDRPQKPVTKPTSDKSDKDKIKLEDLDEKLDELLEGDIKMA